MTAPFFSWQALEVSVVELLQDYGIFRYPINPLDLASRMGIEVRFYSEYDYLLRQAIVNASEDAFLVVDRTRCKPYIFVNEAVSPQSRFGFSVCHEIAHWWLGHEIGINVEEEEANYFAGYLLAPHPLIINRGLNQLQVQNIFGIGEWPAEIAIKQAHRARRHRQNWREHEEWILKNLILQ